MKDRGLLQARLGGEILLERLSSLIKGGHTWPLIVGLDRPSLLNGLGREVGGHLTRTFGLHLL